MNASDVGSSDNRAATRLTGRLAFAWVGACATAELIGIGTAAGVAISGDVIGGGAPGDPLPLRLAVYTLSILAGAVEGAGLGYVRGVVLARRLPGFPVRPFLWSLIGIGMAGWAIGMIPSTFLATESGPDGPAEPALVTLLAVAALSGAAGGLLIGLVEWLVLRRVAAGLVAWVVWSTLAWSAAFVVIFAGAQAIGTDWLLWQRVGAGALTGLSAGIVLGLVSLPGLAALRGR
jgi:hypothetical protein